MSSVQPIQGQLVQQPRRTARYPPYNHTMICKRSSIAYVAFLIVLGIARPEAFVPSSGVAGLVRVRDASCRSATCARTRSGLSMSTADDHDILLRVAKGEKADRAPVWLMRQVGAFDQPYFCGPIVKFGYNRQYDSTDSTVCRAMIVSCLLREVCDVNARGCLFCCCISAQQLVAIVCAVRHAVRSGHFTADTKALLCTLRRRQPRALYIGIYAYARVCLRLIAKQTQGYVLCLVT